MLGGDGSHGSPVDGRLAPKEEKGEIKLAASHSIRSQPLDDTATLLHRRTMHDSVATRGDPSCGADMSEPRRRTLAVGGRGSPERAPEPGAAVARARVCSTGGGGQPTCLLPYPNAALQGCCGERAARGQQPLRAWAGARPARPVRNRARLRLLAPD